MKSTPLLPALALAAALAGASTASAQTVYAYWSFQTTTTGSTFTTDVAAETFAGTPVFSRTGSNITNQNTTADGNFVAADGVTYSGQQNLVWNANGTPIVPSTGNSFTVGLDTTGVEDLALSFRYRSAGTGAAASLGAIEYSTNGGSSWTTLTAAGSSLTTGSWQSFSASYAAVSALDNQSSLLLRVNIPDLSGAALNSFRIDNLQITAATAIPEPSAFAAIAGLGALGFVASRRRRR